MDISCGDIVIEAYIIMLFMKVLYNLRISMFKWECDDTVIAKEIILISIDSSMEFVGAGVCNMRTDVCSLDFHGNKTETMPQ